MEELKLILEETKQILKESKELEKEKKQKEKQIKEQQEKINIIALEETIKELLNNEPLFYDEHKILWKWNKDLFFWEIIDEPFILNILRKFKLCDINTVSSRARWINAIKQEARKRIPKKLEDNEIQFKDQILNLTTKEWRKATPLEFCVNPIPHKLGDSKKCEKFDKLFSEWVNKENIINLYEIIAFCLIPKYFIERMIVLIGSGGNGKSVYKTILCKLIGQKNTTTTDLNLLIASRFASASLYTKLLCEIGETNITKLKETSILKRLCSGKDQIRAELKGKDEFQFINYAKILISTNTLPDTEDKQIGFYRKWLIIDFPNTFEKEKDLITSLTEEDFENLTARALETLYTLLESLQFTNEGTFEERRAKYEEKANPLDKFLNETFEYSEFTHETIPKWEIRQAINHYLKSIGRLELTDRTINELMINHNFGQTLIHLNNKVYRAFTNIRWKNKT
jgi:P4 family phage/plasmid primase-like protien